MSLIVETVSSQKTRLSANPYFVSIGVFLFFAVLFLLLRTRQYLAVDGALRCLDVYHRQELFFHQNNHLWYPANIFFWSRVLGWLGLKARTPFEFIALCQALNATAAAGCLAALYVLSWLATSSVRVSLAVVSVYGFSRAFLLHATNSAEPVVGLFYSVLGLLMAVESLRSNRSWLLVLSGASFGMALASYQSMVLVAPLALLLCVGWPTVTARVPSLNTRLIRFGYLSLGGFLAICAADGLAYWKSGETTVTGMIHRFFELQGGKEVYGYFSLAKLVNPPFGLISALLPALPPDYAGVRSLLRENHKIFWIGCASLALAWLCGIFWLLARPVIAKWRSIDRSRRLLTVALLLSLLILMGPLIYWDPLYDKLWLQPLGVIIFLLAVLYRIGSPHARRRAAVIAVVCLLALEASLNMLWAIPAHRNPTRGLSESVSVAEIVKPNDFVVLGFDGVSMLYLTLWGSAQNTLILPASTREEASSRIARAIKETRETGGSVYFLGVFDVTERAWTDFLGNRVGIPYHSFDGYRSQSTVVRSIEFDGQTVTLRRLK